MLSLSSKGSVNKIINYAYVSVEDINKWKSIGFKEDSSFAMVLWDAPVEDENVVMIREPIKIEEYGIERLLGNEIIDICPYLGSYGMGGPGYFGFKINVGDDEMWIVVCIWGSDEYMILDDRVFHSTIQFKKDFCPWYNSYEAFNKYFKNELLYYKIKSILLNDGCMTMVVEKEGKIRHIKLFKNNKSLPPMGSGKERVNAFDGGVMKDYLMVIPACSNLFLME